MKRICDMKYSRMNAATVGLVVSLLACGSAKAQTVWKSATDGLWSDASAWTAGVPAFNAALITNTAAAYTVGVGTGVSGTFSDLTLANAGVNTTRLEIAGGTLVGSNGVVSVNTGGALLLKAGATLKYGTAAARASDFATVAGVLRIEDGLFQVGTPGEKPALETRRLNVMPGGRLEMTNGAASFYSANAGGLNVNGGTFRMSGGSMTLVNTNETTDGSYSSFRLFNAGTVRLEGSAKLVTSNAFYLDSAAGTTSRLVIAGTDASFVFKSIANNGRPSLNASGYTAIDVYDGMLVVGTNTDFTESNFYPNNSAGTIAVNQWGGYVSFKQIVMARDKSAGMAQVNLYGGVFDMPGAGTISVGRDSFKAGPIAQVNVSGGVFDMTDTAKVWSNGGAPALAVGWNYNGQGRTPWGQILLADGVVSNAGACILGQNKATRGDLLQTGGTFIQGCGNETLATNAATGAFILGFSTGEGHVLLSNGLFAASRSVYVGGADALARWGMTKIYASAGYGNTNVAAGSVGSFTVAGGSVVISNTVAGKPAILHVGDYGTGTVAVAASGSLFAQQLDLHASADGTRASTLRFTFGPQGVGAVACSNLVIAVGAKLVVNADAYTGTASIIPLIRFEAKTGDFAPADVTITGTRNWELRTTATGLWLRRETGTAILVN